MRPERHAAQRTRRRLRGVSLAALLVCGCSKPGDAGAVLRRAPDTPGPRPSGCIDTPFIGGDYRATTSGINCGRERSPNASLLRGRVVREALGGLPGAGLEGLWVTVHPVEAGPLRLDALGPAKAEARTGPQGSFTIELTGAREFVIAVRAEPGGPPLTARRIGAQPRDAGRGELVLTVPREQPVAPD